MLYGRGLEEPGQRLLLHASWIAFTDPETGRRVEVEASRDGVRVRLTGDPLEISLRGKPALLKPGAWTSA